MEKAAKFLGIDKGIGEAVKNVLLLLATAISLSFTVGTQFGKAKDIPVRLEAVENNQIQTERRLDRFESKVDAMLAGQQATRDDVRELRTFIMGNRK